MTTTAYAQAGRQAKATKIASTLLDQQPARCWLDSGIAEAPKSFRLTAAKQAGIRTAIRDGKVPSDETWAIVIDQLRADALFSEPRRAKGPVDPGLMVD
jgi:hypothetical protein